MTSWVQPLGVLLPVAYLVAALLHGMAFAEPHGPDVRRARAWVLALTVVLHVAWFAALAVARAASPVFDPWTNLSAIALVSVLLHLAVTAGVHHAGPGSLVLAAGFCLQLLASSFGDLRPGPAAQPLDPLRLTHVVTSVLAASALVLSGLFGGLYLAEWRRLRSHRIGAFVGHMPDLSLLARTIRRAALAGFAFMTFGLNLGIWAAHRYSVSGFDYGDPHVVLTFFLWLHFGVVAFSGGLRLMSQRRAALAAVGGLVALVCVLLLFLVPGLTFHGSGG